MAGIDANTVLMLHCNGVDASTSFPDNSDSAHAMSAQGDAQVDTARKQFGTGAALFDATGDYISGPDSFNFSTNDFAFDCWIYPTDVSTVDFAIISKGYVTGGINGNYTFRITNPGSKLQFVTFDGTGNEETVIGGTGISVNTWQHVAVERVSGTVDIYLGGVSDGTGAISKAIFGSGANLNIGRQSTGGGGAYFAGSIDEIRISDVLRYNGGFTPEITEYTDDRAGVFTARRLAYPINKVPPAALVW